MRNILLASCPRFHYNTCRPTKAGPAYKNDYWSKVIVTQTFLLCTPVEKLGSEIKDL